MKKQKAEAQPQDEGSKPTGGYAYCPNSGTVHPLFAKQVMRSKTGNLWFKCVCSFRGYFPKGNPTPKMTRDEAIAMGAVIPDELLMQPMPIPFPMPVAAPQWREPSPLERPRQTTRRPVQ